jgi:hypothetical protein
MDGLLPWSLAALWCAACRASLVVVHRSRTHRRHLPGLVHYGRELHRSPLDMATDRPVAAAVDDRSLRIRLARRNFDPRVGRHRDRPAAGPGCSWRRRARVPTASVDERGVVVAEPPGESRVQSGKSHRCRPRDARLSEPPIEKGRMNEPREGSRFIHSVFPYSSLSAQAVPPRCRPAACPILSNHRIYEPGTEDHSIPSHSYSSLLPGLGEDFFFLRSGVK